MSVRTLDGFPLRRCRSSRGRRGDGRDVGTGPVGHDDDVRDAWSLLREVGHQVRQRRPARARADRPTGQRLVQQQLPAGRDQHLAALAGQLVVPSGRFVHGAQRGFVGALVRQVAALRLPARAHLVRAAFGGPGRVEVGRRKRAVAAVHPADFVRNSHNTTRHSRAVPARKHRPARVGICAWDVASRSS
jgi:hypothetical protein